MRGVKQYRSKGKTYCYHRLTGKRIAAAPGTAEFFAEIEGLNSATKLILPRAGTLGMLLGKYRASVKFAELAPRTQADYRRIMDWLKPLDTMALSIITPPFAAGLRDKAKAAHKYRFANYVLSVLSAALSWGAEHGHIDTNTIKGHVKKAPRPKGMPQRNRPWTTDERNTVLQEAPLHLKVPVAMMRWAGLRTGDALIAPKSSFDGTAIEIRTGKTGQLVWLPCPVPLRAVLKAALTKHPNAITLATTSRGRPWTGGGFRASLAKFLGKLVAAGRIGKGLSPHGLRHSMAVDLRELGFDERTIADFLGQSQIETARGYARGADLRKKMTATVKKLDISFKSAKKSVAG